MMRYSWLAACSVIALAPATVLSAKPTAESTAFDRAKAIDVVRGALLAAQPPGATGEADARTQLAQWYNWPNWGNWNNWQNWGNWGNWGNY
jgi:hypothetical protein